MEITSQKSFVFPDKTGRRGRNAFWKVCLQIRLLPSRGALFPEVELLPQLVFKENLLEQQTDASIFFPVSAATSLPSEMSLSSRASCLRGDRTTSTPDCWAGRDDT